MSQNPLAKMHDHPPNTLVVHPPSNETPKPQQRPSPTATSPDVQHLL